MGKRRTLGLLLCLLLLLCTACGGRTQNDTGDLHCTVTIECATVLAHMDDPVSYTHLTLPTIA